MNPAATVLVLRHATGKSVPSMTDWGINTRKKD
uniref:Uncharacterized protein n=1 Tax=Arundo donax TaxID=35708 RepID=A0A0A9HHM2_ARUDO